jgi:hypothetical protein
MSKTITLPSGNTAVIRDAKSLKHKDRAKALAAINGDNAYAQTESIMSAVISMLVESWSFDLIIPSIAPASLGELSLADYDALVIEAAEAQKELNLAFTSTRESESNPDSPFENSNA